jgi:hypothetical protein
MSKANGKLFTTDGRTVDVTFSSTHAQLREMQDLVGGYIEVLWLKDGNVLVVNEEGKINGLAYNETATEVVQVNGMDDIIVGNAILMESRYLS